MRILLVYVLTEKINMPVLPLGTACLAAALEKAGHECLCVNAGPGFSDGLKSAAASFSPDATGVSVRNVDDQNPTAPVFLMDQARDVVRELKALTRAPVVAGGAGFTMFAKEALIYIGADYGVAGEGETVLPRLLSCLEHGGDPSEIPGVLVRGKAHPASITTEKRLDLFPLPLPGVHLAVPADWRGPELFVPVQTRRGCAMDCSYCSTASIEGRRLRRRSPLLVAENLEKFVEAGFDRFFFVDNTFNLPPSYAHALCDAIIDRGLSIEWRAIVYPRRIREALVLKMARAGCREVSLGFETGSPSMLKRYNKRFTLDDVREASGLFAAHGIRRLGFLLLGGPGETRETVLESLDFADSLAPEALKVTCGVRVYPGTLLESQARAEGFLPPEGGLLRPCFYLAPSLSGWLPKTVRKWAETRPWVIPS